MSTIPLRLPDEMRQVLRENPGEPLPLEDDETHQVYVVVDQDLHRRAMQALQQQEDVQAIQAGLDAAANGLVAPLEEVDARIRKKFGFPPPP
ncbi:MAG: hypothetical protein HUU20_22550 [Pirellulales bacterium]|nr:hypothetical protein [Pirellulales bacterium]